MPPRQTSDLPNIWLLSDERNDAALEDALARLPQRSALVFRHYHLSPAKRRARFAVLAAKARGHGHAVIVSGAPTLALKWGADGVYGPPAALGSSEQLLRIATAHDLPELVAARRAGADAAMLSPVFATRSHDGARGLGPVRFRLLAAKAGLPVIALGGMDAARAKRLQCPRWAAIDGLASPPTP